MCLLVVALIIAVTTSYGQTDSVGYEEHFNQHFDILMGRFLESQRTGQPVDKSPIGKVVRMSIILHVPIHSGVPYETVRVLIKDFVIEWTDETKTTHRHPMAIVGYKKNPNEGQEDWRKFIEFDLTNPSGGDVPSGGKIEGKVVLRWPKRFGLN